MRLMVRSAVASVARRDKRDSTRDAARACENCAKDFIALRARRLRTECAPWHVRGYLATVRHSPTRVSHDQKTGRFRIMKSFARLRLAPHRTRRLLGAALAATLSRHPSHRRHSPRLHPRQAASMHSSGWSSPTNISRHAA